MKKAVTKLSLGRETVRKLADRDLKRVAGGDLLTQYYTCGKHSAGSSWQVSMDSCSTSNDGAC